MSDLLRAYAPKRSPLQPMKFGGLLHSALTAERIYYFLFSLDIFILILLPTGTFSGINFKIIAFLAILPLAIRVAIDQANTIRSLVAPMAVVCLLSIWALIGAAYGGDLSLAMQQMKDLLATILSTWFVALYCRLAPDNPIRFIRMVIWISLAVSTAKALIFAYSIISGIPIIVFVDGISRIFNTELTTATFEDSILGRFELFSDGVIPLCVFSILAIRDRLNLSLVFSLVAVLIFSYSVLVSFSRYLWIYLLLAMILGILVGRKRMLPFYLVAISSVAIALNYETFAAIVEFRFSEKVAGSSDIERTVQAGALRDFFFSAPFFGHGLGSYTTAVIRSQSLPYAYENQLTALLGQIGIIGCLLLLALTAIFYRRILFSTAEPVLWRLTVIALLSAWIVGGFLNPQLLSSVASISYGFIFALSWMTPQVAGPNNG